LNRIKLGLLYSYRISSAYTHCFNIRYGRGTYQTCCDSVLLGQQLRIIKDAWRLVVTPLVWDL
jgi:hypothetical protein